MMDHSHTLAPAMESLIIINPMRAGADVGAGVTADVIVHSALACAAVVACCAFSRPSDPHTIHFFFLPGPGMPMPMGRAKSAPLAPLASRRVLRVLSLVPALLGWWLTPVSARSLISSIF